MEKKHFIITIDTEGDDMWSWHEGMPITTRNAAFLPRFQELCDKYGFKPTWLVNWEMMNDKVFSEYASQTLKDHRCEIGMHLHAWNTPPNYDLPKHKESGLPYLIEYPTDVMEEKIDTITRRFKEVFGFDPISHRAGRWGMDDRYFALLRKYGYKVDCSVTPFVSWTKSIGQTPGFAGPDYSKEKNKLSYRNSVMEVPLSTMLSRKSFTNKEMDKKCRVFWLRPQRNNLKSMLYLIKSKSQSKLDHLEFMIHSSELMPGGSPTFKTEEDIEKLYKDMDIVFNRISANYEGNGLGEYYSCKASEL